MSGELLKSKMWYASKTFWVTLVMALSPLIPQVKAFVVDKPETFAMIWGVLALVIRKITKEKVVLTD